MNTAGFRTLVDFSDDLASPGWTVVNDDVMGGKSQGKFHIQGGILTFAGSTDTNGGGFASIRSEAMELSLNRCNGIWIRFLGDGRTYQLRLDVGESYAFRASFGTEDASAGWHEVSIPFSRFEAVERGTALPDISLTPGAIQGLGLMIYDENNGPFELKVSSIGAYGCN